MISLNLSTLSSHNLDYTSVTMVTNTINDFFTLNWWWPFLKSIKVKKYNEKIIIWAKNESDNDYDDYVEDDDDNGDRNGKWKVAANRVWLQHLEANDKWTFFKHYFKLKLTTICKVSLKSIFRFLFPFFVFRKKMVKFNLNLEKILLKKCSKFWPKKEKVYHNQSSKRKVCS